jgi:hypothetical protein
MESFRIVLLCVVAAIAYGILQDQFTARICLEYFTVAHPPLGIGDDPTVIALAWGAIATWWAGAAVGGILAIAARLGDSPPRTAVSLVRPVLKLMAFMASCALLAGIIGWFLAGAGAVFLIGPISRALPPERHQPFIAVLWTHSASYLAGFLGGAMLAVLVWRSRRSVTGEPG